jgi:hypothetical protein
MCGVAESPISLSDCLDEPSWGDRPLSLFLTNYLQNIREIRTRVTFCVPALGVVLSGNQTRSNDAHQEDHFRSTIQVLLPRSISLDDSSAHFHKQVGQRKEETLVSIFRRDALRKGNNLFTETLAKK